MRDTTLIYIEYKDSYLMLLRNKKENDLNEGKWIGVGGKVEAGETPEQCAIREVREETGIELEKVTARGVIDFISDTWDDERMYLYTASVESSYFAECNEGTLRWIPKSEIMSLNLWEGDRYFLGPLVSGESDINMCLVYEGDTLKKVVYPYESKGANI